MYVPPSRSKWTLYGPPSRGSEPLFLRKHINCDFPGGGGPDSCPSLDPPMRTAVLRSRLSSFVERNTL